MKVYGYCRISRKSQNIERQIRNIKAAFPDADIKKEIYTGTKIQGRVVLDRLLKSLNPGDTIVFDSVSRMSRDADEGFQLYEELYRHEINLIFLKERHIDTDTYKKALKTSVPLTGSNVDYILEGINKYLLSLAKEQIYLAFSQAQKEVDDLHKRTSEGLQTAKNKGKKLGNPKGIKIVTQKSREAKKTILKYSRDFNGFLKDSDVMTIAKINKNAFYKYKKELRETLAGTAKQEISQERKTYIAQYMLENNSKVAEGHFGIPELIEGIEFSSKDIITYKPDVLYSLLRDDIPESTANVLERVKNLPFNDFETFRKLVSDRQYENARDWYARSMDEYNKKVKKGPVSATGARLYSIIPQNNFLLALDVTVNCRTKHGVEKMLSQHFKKDTPA